MSLALFITAENPPEGVDLFVNGKTMGHATSKLAAAASELGVPDLMSFFSQSPEDGLSFLEEEGELALEEAPEEEWFPASEGLRSVQTLARYFETTPEEARLVEELREFEAVLLHLQSEGVRWHLSVDF